MRLCAECRSIILFGGKREGDARLCSARCHARHVVLIASRMIPEDVVNEQVRIVHAGPCPKCKKRSPVDVYVHHSIASVIILTYWKSQELVSCRFCGRKQQLLDTVASALVGWWGIPVGILLTPIQIAKNIVAMVGGPKDSEPSMRLKDAVRRQMATEAMKAGGVRQDA